MGNTALEDTERERGEKSFRQVLEQLIEALAVVGERADLEKQAADRAKIDAEVRLGKWAGCQGTGVSPSRVADVGVTPEHLQSTP